MKSLGELFLIGPSPQEMAQIKKQVQDGPPFDKWEDYYWSAKILCEYDEDEFDAHLLIKTLNAAIQHGLTYRVNREFYLDALKILATLYSQLGQHEHILNCLGSFLDLDENAPDWVYHDYVSAQIHTDQIKRMLRGPETFLSDLNKNDDGSAATCRRQKNIYKEFLVEAVRYLITNPESHVNIDFLTRACEQYGLQDSEGWKAFLDILNGNVSSPIIGQSAPSSSSIVATLENGTLQARPLIISLFPEDNAEDSAAQENLVTLELEKKYTEVLAQLEIAQQDLELAQKTLEDKEASLTELYQEKEAATSNAEEQKRLQERIACTIKENKALKAKVAELEAQQTLQQEKVERGDIIGHIHSYLHDTQLALIKWLEHNLPPCSRNWWETCVIDVLTYEQRERAHENRYTSLSQFDLPALLRIMRKNWGNFRSFMYLTESDWDCLQAMIEVRNRWAHMEATLPTVEEVKEDLYTIAEFMTQVHCSRDTVKDVQKYAHSLDK